MKTMPTDTTIITDSVKEKNSNEDTPSTPTTLTPMALSWPKDPELSNCLLDKKPASQKKNGDVRSHQRKTKHGLVHVGAHFRQSGCHNKKRHPTTIPPIAKKDPAEEHQIKEDRSLAKSLYIEQLQALFRRLGAKTNTELQPFYQGLLKQSLVRHCYPPLLLRRKVCTAISSIISESLS
jgi:hypothetical protein